MKYRIKSIITCVLILIAVLWSLINAITAYCYFKQGEKAFLAANYEEAAITFQKAVGKWPFSPEYRFYYAESLAFKKDFDKAKDEFYNTYKLFPWSKTGKRCLDENIKIYTYQQKQQYLATQEFIKQENLKYQINSKPQEIKTQQAKQQEYSKQQSQKDLQQQQLKHLEDLRKQADLEQNSNPQNYINYTTDDGKMMRWNLKKMPIKVFIDNANAPPNANTIIKDAFDIWMNALNGVAHYTFINDPNSADIKISYKNSYNDLKSVIGGDAAGLASPKIEGNILKSVDINIVSRNKQNTFMSDDNIYLTAVHEIGHALGLRNHSNVKSDIMYTTTFTEYEDLGRARGLSKRDINTIKLLYTLNPDISNFDTNGIPVKNNAAKNILLGDESTRKYQEIQEATRYVKNSSNQAHSWESLGRKYYNNNQYSDAINAYKKSLEINPDYNAARSGLAYTYKKLNYNQDAINEYNILIKSDPGNIWDSFNLAFLYLKTNQYSAAKNTINTLVSANPKAMEDESISKLYNAFQDEHIMPVVKGDYIYYERR